ncbi:hypothetical protein [Apilactobacillus timberlakei]|uniref:hypothetical protein n=1 Tax=Apilactobacillus timberlakei TaxID=2008380 RepID=UPI00112930A5|nr:hypothetical protein [Apilactobacillus timberlakei]TPR21512.1 hypothetical protein DY083_05695 [Apilactobacillus timberlakei]
MQFNLTVSDYVVKGIDKKHKSISSYIPQELINIAPNLIKTIKENGEVFVLDESKQKYTFGIKILKVKSIKQLDSEKEKDKYQLPVLGTGFVHYNLLPPRALKFVLSKRKLLKFLPNEMVGKKIEYKNKKPVITKTYIRVFIPNRLRFEKFDSHKIVEVQNRITKKHALMMISKVVLNDKAFNEDEYDYIKTIIS